MREHEEHGAVALAVNGLSKTFDGITALDGVTLSFCAGEAHALVGENGAGKSTLVKLVSGHTRPSEGSIEICGTQARQLTPALARRLGVAVIYQEPSLVEGLSVAENIFLGALPRKGLLVDRRRLMDGARSLLADLGVELDPRTPASALSVSQRQFVEAAKAVAAHARVIVFDEPTAPLSQADCELMYGLVERLRAGGAAVIYITHRMEEVFRLCSRVSVMRDGRVVRSCATSQLTRAKLIRLMVGRSLTEVYPGGRGAAGGEVLRVEHLASGFVRDVSFSLRSGEILGFAGLAGAGRSETMRALFGARPVEGGVVRLGSERVAIGSPRQAMALGIGYVPEDRKREGLVLNESVGRNLTLTTLKSLSRRLLVSRSRERSLVARYAESLHIKAAGAEQRVSALSGGNQQKVVVGKWLATDSRILIFDEPTQGIDVGAKHEIYCMMRELASRGYAIIMVSSDMDELLGMSDRIVVLREGRVAGELSGPAEFGAERVLRLASGERESEAA